MGYCTVTGADELAAHAALKMSFELFRGAFAHHGGAAIYHPGDAVLAEFSTVAGAVAAAEGVQAAIAATRASGRRGLEFRIGVILFDLCQFDEVLRHVEQAQILARELNARRFEPLNLTYRAKVHRLSQEHAQARAVIEAALAISEEVGMSYNGARVLGEAALNEPDPARRKAILAKGEALLAAGCIGSNHLWFYRDAIDACLERDDAAEALRFAAALGRYASQEPMVWTDTVVRRCEHLVAARDGGAQSAKDITEMVAAFGYRSLAAGIPGRAPSLSGG